MHFSQWAPEDVDEVATLVVNAGNPPGYDPANDPYSIRNQAARMSDTWETLEMRREDRREKRRKAEEQAREARREQEYPPYPYYSPPFYYRPIYRPIWPPGHRPHPPHVKPPAWPIKPTSEWIDPMRSAHIGVRRRAPAGSRATGN